MKKMKKFPVACPFFPAAVLCVIDEAARARELAHLAGLSRVGINSHLKPPRSPRHPTHPPTNPRRQGMP